MSRKAREPIMIPSGVEVALKDNEISVKGPKGSLSCSVSGDVVVTIAENKIVVNPAPHVEVCPGRMQGLFWALIANMVSGVNVGFEKKLEMVGVGYRAVVQGDVLDLSIGVSHPTKMLIPVGLSVLVEKNTFISIKGISKQEVGQFAANIRAKRPPEPYKGKGIRYANEVIRRKAGKTGKTGKK